MTMTLAHLGRLSSGLSSDRRDGVLAKIAPELWHLDGKGSIVKEGSSTVRPKVPLPTALPDEDPQVLSRGLPASLPGTLQTAAHTSKPILAQSPTLPSSGSPPGQDILAGPSLMHLTVSPPPQILSLPLGGRIALHHDVWTLLSQRRWVLQTVMGYHLEFSKHPLIQELPSLTSKKSRHRQA